MYCKKGYTTSSTGSVLIYHNHIQEYWCVEKKRKNFHLFFYTDLFLKRFYGAYIVANVHLIALMQILFRIQTQIILDTGLRHLWRQVYI